MTDKSAGCIILGIARAPMGVDRMWMSLWLLPLAAPVQDAAVAQAKSYAWTCNSPQGYYSANGLAVRPDMTVRGAVQFVDRHNRGKWGSAATVYFRKTKDDRLRSGLRFYFKERKAKFIAVQMVGYDTGREVEIGKVDSTVPIAFTLALASDGVLSATVGGQRFVANGKPIEGGVANVACSSAQVAFTDLSVPIIEY